MILIGRFAADKLERVINIINSREASLRDTGVDEVEIDFEKLKPATLRELEKYISSCLKAKPRKPEGKLFCPLLYNVLL